MRTITANAYMTLDGRGAFPDYPRRGGPSTEPNALFRTFWFDRFDDVTTVVMGRRSFLGHQKVWSEKALDPTEPAWLLEYRRYLDRVDKVCLSTRLESTDWQNSRIMRGDLAEILAKLRRERKGGNIMVEGGPAIVRECLRRNLADDYWFYIQPVIYGKGPRYWGPMNDGQTTLDLVETKFGVDKQVLLHYRAIR